MSSTIHAYFDADGHLMFTYLDGTQVASTIPPGTYQVIYDNLGADDLAVDHAFHLFGPGRQLPARGDGRPEHVQRRVRREPTYTLQDDLHPALERRTFVATTAGGGSSEPTPTSTSNPKSTTKPVSNDVVGSDLKRTQSSPLRGTLTGAMQRRQGS